MQILWVGCLESDEEFERKAMKGYTLASAQISQKNLIQGLEEVSGLHFDSINGSVLPHYPIYKDKKVVEIVWHHSISSYDVSVGYSNRKYINRVHCRNAMIKASKYWIKNRYQNEELIIFVYSMRSAPMSVACKLKQRIPNSKIYLIITDLPQYMDLDQSWIKKTLKKIDFVNINEMKNHFDGFILYASKMASYLRIPNQKWILMEGCYNGTEFDSEPSCVSKKAFMYSGLLNERYGIKLLLDAFMKIERKDIELWITGGGSAEKYIKECAEHDKRIKFYGFLPNRKSILAMQKNALALVNMRLPSEESSTYCFPSKLLEYMATGNVTLSFSIAGIPNEYKKYIIEIPGESILDIKTTIEQVLQMTEKERTNFGKDAKKFVLLEKTPQKQAKRIWNWICQMAF